MAGAYVRNLLDTMTLEEKVGQVFVFTLRNLRQALNDLQLYPGGFVRIYSDVLTVAKQNRILQMSSRIPLFLAADFEQGVAPTVAGGIHAVPAMALGAADNEHHTFAIAKAIAEEASAIGINVDFMPVLDVNTSPHNPVINIRSFGEDPDAVARHGVMFLRGLAAGGVLGCGKHFPGHGATQVDSHSGLPVVEATREELEQVEFVPFREAIRAGLEFIMTGHLSVPALDPSGQPATISRIILNDVLRRDLGFKGVIISDALDMGAIVRSWSEEEAVIRAFLAGCDMLLMPTEPQRAYHALLDAVKRGVVPEERMDDAVRRILELKEKAGLFSHPFPHFDLADLAGRMDSDEHRNAVRAAALASVSLMKSTGEIPPLQRDARVAILLLSNNENARQSFFEPKTFPDHCAAMGQVIDIVHFGDFCQSADRRSELLQRAQSALNHAEVVVLAAYVRIVLGSGEIGLSDHFAPILNLLREGAMPTVVVSFGHPYLIKQFPRADAFVCAFGHSDIVQEVTARLLYGEAQFSGRVPVRIA